MVYNILTLFPEMVLNGLNTSILGRAAGKKLIEINAVNIRDYTLDKHGRVDDYAYGGGAGMLMQAQPVFDAYQAVAKGRKLRTVYMTPQGTPFTQKLAADFAKEEELVFLCGHYEGIDERVLEEIVTDYISIGDYVLTGGELPAMVVIDAISRLVPGVLGNEASAQTETFHNDLLEYPQYSRPEEWHGKKVPEVLLSGNHSRIEAWRLGQSEERTRRLRPDLYGKYREKQQLVRLLSQNKRNNIHIMESLLRGTGDILYWEGRNFLVYNRECGSCMAGAETKEAAEAFTGLIPPGTGQIISSDKFLNDMLGQRFSLQTCHECRLACYTRREPLPAHHRDIRILAAADLPYVCEHSPAFSEAYLLGRIQAKALYGAYVENRLAGFGGIHSDGSMGMLFVDKAYRRQGLGRELEAYVANCQRGQGYTPYAYILSEDEAVLHMQESLGLYLSGDTVWRLH